MDPHGNGQKTDSKSLIARSERLLYDMKKRRSVRLFSERTVPEEVVVNCISERGEPPALVVRGHTGPCSEKTDT